MVAASSTSSMNLSVILTTLESKKTNLDDKIEAYTTLSTQLREKELSFISLDLTKQADRVLTVLKKDIQNESNAVRQGALQVLGFCLHDTEIVRFLTPASSCELLTLLRQCVEKTEDKTTATRALWCLSQQHFAEAVVVKELPVLLVMCELAFSKWKNQSTAVEYEALNVVSRFVDQIPAEMKSSCPKWAKLVVTLVAHPAIKIRERVLPLLDTCLPWMVSNKELRTGLVQDFRTKQCPELKKLFHGNEIYVLRVWRILVKLFGEELHHGSFINHMLPLAELGFKHALAEVKIEAFKSWKYLIDNFALNPSIISDPKRVKLIMQVFKINNAKVESVAMEKLQIWWHFVRALGAKISQNFDQVVLPLLQFCIGGSRNSSVHPMTPTTPHMGLKNAMSSPVTPRLNLSVSSPGMSRPVFPALQLKGCDVLAHILVCPSKMPDLPKVVISLGKWAVMSEVVSGTPMFLKHASVIVSCSLDLIGAQGSHIPESLLMYIWHCLLHHLRSAIESSSRSENREALSSFLGHFQTLVFSQSLTPKTIMKLFVPVCNLPQKALASTAYNINSGKVVRGTPALFLCEVLLAPTLLKDLASSENFISLFSTLINCGTSTVTGVLEFCQAVTNVLNEQASFITNPDALWRLWSILANTLQEHVVKTNEVNQGDSLEYNFDSLYAALLFPVKNNLSTRLNQPICKSLLKTWGELYRSFTRLSALVTTAEANIACEEFCQKVLHCLEEESSKESAVVEFVAQMCQVVVDNVDFSSLGSNNGFAHGASLSPSKWIKRKNKPMENLQSFIKLLVHLLEDLAELTESGEPTLTAKQKPANVTAGATLLVDVLSTLFTHITVSTIIARMLGQLATPISWFFSGSGRKTCSKLFNAAFMQKLEKLWLDISTCIQSRYTMQYDTEFLTCVSPLLQETLLHPRRQIKNQSLILWKATFSHVAGIGMREPFLAIYPEDLKPVLMKVKEKTPIMLPGWVQTDTNVIEETPFSQYSQMDSFTPDARLPGLPSPHKIVGSFMHKAVSPNIKKSPAKLPPPDVRPVGTARKKLSVNDFRDEDFVVIKMSPKKKRVLTEHQKEVMKERRTLPVMYNNLDLSQDVSLMASQFNTDTQQDSITMQSQPQSDNSVIVINSSQSQNLEHDKVPATVPKSSSTESLADDPTSDGKRGRRRRSVRFSNDDSQEKEGEKSEMKSPPNAPPTLRSLRSRKDTKPSDEEQKSNEKEPKSADKESKLTKNDFEGSKDKEAFKDSKVKGNKDDESVSSSVNIDSSEPSASPSLKQNLMHALGDQWLNTLRSSSSSSLGKSDSSVGSKCEEESVKESGNSTSGSQNSQEGSVEHFSPFKSISQSPPERRSRSPGKKSLSQEVTSSAKSPNRSRDRSKSTQAGSLDKWLVKSPAKGKSPVSDPKSPDESFVPDTQLSTTMEVSLLHAVVEDTMSPSKGTHMSRKSSHSFVEDTQSPSKFSEKNLFSPDINASIEETPVKDSSSVLPGPLSLPSSRNLFGECDKIESQDQESDDKENDVKLGTPVLKIKKLTTEEINVLSHGSPEKAVSKALFKEPLSVCEDSASQNADVPCSQGFPTADTREDLETMESQFSPVFPRISGERPDSQIAVNSDPDSNRHFELWTERGVVNASSSSSNYSVSVLNPDSVKRSSQDSISQSSEIPKDKEAEMETGEKFTEELFETCPTDTVTAYNPDSISTLKEGSSQSTTASSSSQSTSSSQSSQANSEAETILSEGSYKVDLVSTLADEPASRRRKQDTPKKMGLEDLRRTPRQRKKKTFDGFEVDGISKSENPADSTPSRRGARPPSAKKRLEKQSEDKQSSQEKEPEKEEELINGKEEGKKKVGRQRKSLKESDEIDSSQEKIAENEEDVLPHRNIEEVRKKYGRTRKVDVSSSQSEQDSQEKTEPRRGRKRKADVEENDEEEDDLPLSQVSQSKSASKRQGRNKTDLEETEEKTKEAPKRKRTRKSLATEMTESENLESQARKRNPLEELEKTDLGHDCNQKEGDESKADVDEETKSDSQVKQTYRNPLKVDDAACPESSSSGGDDSSSSQGKKPRRIQPQMVDPGQEMIHPAFTVGTKETPIILEESCVNSESTDSKESDRQTEESQQGTEVIIVGMEFDSSKSLNEQTPEESQMSSEDISKEGEQTPSAKPSQVPVRRSTTKQKIEAARKRSISKMSDKKSEDSSVDDPNEWTESKCSAVKTVLIQEKNKDKDSDKVDSPMDVIDSSQTQHKSMFVNLDLSFCKDSPRAAEHDKIKGKVDEIISSLASPVPPGKDVALGNKRKRNMSKPKVSSPVSVRLRSSKLVLRARAKLAGKTVSKVSPLTLVRTRNRPSPRPKRILEEKDSIVDLEVDTKCMVKTDDRDEVTSNCDVVALATIDNSGSAVETETGLEQMEIGSEITETDLEQSTTCLEQTKTGLEKDESVPEQTETSSEKMENEPEKTETGCVDATDTCDENTSLASAPVRPKTVDPLNDTPRKSAEKPKRKVIHAHRGFSDSKVLSLNRIRARNRLADRGMSIVRRSILKQKNSTDNSSPSKRPCDPDFQPIKVFKFHSPSASPSAGILKKRRLISDTPVNSPSPPSKRRVSFAEPIISGESPHRRVSIDFIKSRSAAGKQLFSVPRRPSNSLRAPLSRPKKTVVDGGTDSQPSQSPVSQSQASYRSTQESQLNSSDPVYPDLITCTESVTKVLPQLTSSVWSRGLGQLVKARNIHTVGDLSKLTEVDIHNLPIRSPKVVTVRRVLHDLEQHLEVKRSKDVKATDSESDQEDKAESALFKVPSMAPMQSLDTIEEDGETETKETREEEPDSLPDMEVALDELVPRNADDELNSSIEAEPEVTAESVVESCDQPISQSQSSGSSSQSDSVFLPDSAADAQGGPTPTVKLASASASAEDPGANLANILESLVKENDYKSLAKMRTGDLFKVHQHLTHLSNIVVTAMKSRCHSPTNSQ
ncbi:LOW QUALITY PROTEIN: telomere-associated protein RIF1-like [Haliotis rubra]|uniref:LOW QUALITY PROTEIN: telomere-associated protein RIF1-like n=1 Tax=Haliotis rubra TaxID=36100 RepID=UPI001EE6216F|nr:LOW QUALITY PROTEIN: telomere-associated protein RIF1-like [Haliotis rubra]